MSINKKSNISEKFANRLIKIREQRNLTQEALGLLCGIDRTYIGRIERLERNPTLLIVDKIAQGLDMNVSELLNFNGED